MDEDDKPVLTVLPKPRPIKMDDGDNNKKPIYKKLAFWAFVGVVLFLIYQLSQF